jgi:hypothetical protein
VLLLYSILPGDVGKVTQLLSANQLMRVFNVSFMVRLSAWDSVFVLIFSGLLLIGLSTLWVALQSGRGVFVINPTIS